MATSRIQKFLDQVGVSTLWARILEELDKKASIREVEQVESHVTDLDIALNTMVIYGGSATDVMDGRGSE